MGQHEDDERPHAAGCETRHSVADVQRKSWAQRHTMELSLAILGRHPVVDEEGWLQDSSVQVTQISHYCRQCK